MKFLLIVLLMVPQFSWAAARHVTASGGSPIPTAYSASNSQSQIVECAGNTIKILNQTESVLFFGFGRASAAPELDLSFVPPGPGAGHTIRPDGGPGSGVYLYIRAPAGAVTSGTVEVSCTTEE